MNYHLKPLDPEAFIKQVILFEGIFAPPELVSDVAFLLERNLSGISVTVLFSCQHVSC